MKRGEVLLAANLAVEQQGWLRSLVAQCAYTIHPSSSFRWIKTVGLWSKCWCRWIKFYTSHPSSRAFSLASFEAHARNSAQ